MKKIVSCVLCAAFTVINAEYCSGVDVEKDSEESLFQGLYLGGGIGCNYTRYNSYRIAAGSAVGMMKVYDQQKVDRFIGCFLLGGGATFYRNLYAGLEWLIDFSKSKTKSVLIHGGEYTEIAHDSDGGYVIHKGGANQIGVRLGYVAPDLGAMLYLRGGVAFLGKTELWNDARRTMTGPDSPLEGRPKRAALVFALGVEKNICHDFSVRLEGEVVSKRSLDVNSIAAHSGVDTGWRTRANTKEYNVRLLITYMPPLF
jgi:hypothetical protein